MNLYVLDTDILTLLQEGDPVVGEKVRACQPKELAITVLTVEEQLSGWYTEVRRAKKRERLAMAYSRLANTVNFLSGLRILTYDEPALSRYASLRKLKLNVRKTDLHFAATVLERGAILVSRNLRDFQHIPGLTIEDWSR